MAAVNTLDKRPEHVLCDTSRIAAHELFTGEMHAVK